MINIAELLKDCPKGTKLYSPLFGECELNRVYERNYHTCIEIKFNSEIIYLNEYGKYFYSENKGECLLFPSKDQRDWTKFQKPLPFKDGDILVSENGNLFIFRGTEQHNQYVCAKSYCGVNNSKEFVTEPSDNWTNAEKSRFATEDEKVRFFNVIKQSGYYWNTKTKTLEELSIVPNFKIGDKIKKKDGSSYIHTIKGISGKLYFTNFVDGNNLCNGCIDIDKQDQWELAKFDITTLKPFVSKVLVRDYNSYEDIDDGSDIWRPAIFGMYVERISLPFCVVGGIYFKQCIPYKGNEHLLGTTNDCDDYYKTW